jgi:hypothetical protein
VAPDKGKRSKGRRKAEPASSSPEPRPAVGPGGSYIVRWHPDAATERDASWPPGEKVAIANAGEKLAAAGPKLRFPHSSAVQGSPGQGFRELRPRAGRSRWRPIYRQVAPQTFVVFSVGPEAGIDKHGYDEAVARAVGRSNDLELD